MSLAEIKICKAVMYIEESDLWKHLPRELILKGLQRGKAIKRGQQRAKRRRDGGEHEG